MFARLTSLAIAFCLFCIAAMTAQAADDFDRLAAAIEAANAAGNASIALFADIMLTESLPPIHGALSIEGNGHTIIGNAQFRIFNVVGGTLTLQDLALTGGHASDNGGAIRVQDDARLALRNVSFFDNHAESGGALATRHFDGSVDISDSVFYGNSASGGGGAIFWQGGDLTAQSSVFMNNTAGQSGGAIEALAGDARIMNSTLLGNSANDGGAIMVGGGNVTMTHLTLADNQALPGEASIHRWDGQAILRNSIVKSDGEVRGCAGGLDESSGNISHDGTCAPVSADGIRLGALTGSPAYFSLLDGSPAIDAGDEDFCLPTDQTGAARPQGDGCDVGAIESAAAPPEPTPLPATCDLRHQILAANSNAASGGCPAGTSHDIIHLRKDLKLTEELPAINGTIMIEGNGHAIDAGWRFRIFDVFGGKLTVNNLRLLNGRARGFGGAILVRNNAELAVNNSLFKGNEARAIAMGNGNYRGGGGGAIGWDSAGVKVAVSSSVFHGNSAQFDGGAIYLYGGSLEVRGSAFTSNRSALFGGAVSAHRGRVNIENSAFHRNSSGRAGGISNHGANITLTHLTMLGNSAFLPSGDSIESVRGSTRLRNSIFVGGSPSRPDCQGNMDARHGNFSADGSCGALSAGDPMLGEMTGEPGYFLPLDGSPVVDAADPLHCLATDQRGFTRPAGAACDIGAVELGASPEQ